MSDICDELTFLARERDNSRVGRALTAAATEIAALRARNEQLAGALRTIAAGVTIANAFSDCVAFVQAQAAAALEEHDDA